MADSSVLVAPAIDVVAERLVNAGRVVPGLTVDDDGRARSWWWPLPAVTDRPAIAGLLADPTVETQSEVAAALADATDRLVRTRLVDTDTTVLGPRPGRRSVPEAWVRSLCSADPWLSSSLPQDRLRGLSADVAEWIQSGAAMPRAVSLCLRVLEPADQLSESGCETQLNGADAGHAEVQASDRSLHVPLAPWHVELLVQDSLDSALMAPLSSLMDGGGNPFGDHALEDGLAALAVAVRIAPELAPVLGQSRPIGIDFSATELIEFIQTRFVEFAEAGVQLLLPAWWATGPRFGLKAKSASSGTGADSPGLGGFGFDDIVQFSWAAALGDEELTQADVEALARAAEAKQHLVRFRGQWIEIDPSRLAAVLQRMGETAEATAGELIKAGLGLDALDGADIDVIGVDDSGWIGDLLADTATGRVEPVVAPDGFEGELRAYQQRGVGWLAFLGRVGLGACLADDMGLGKTAQLIGALLADRVAGPTLVVCPVSVLGNWQREIERFAPELTVAVHHGPDRCPSNDDEGLFADLAGDTDVVLTTYSLLPRDQDLFGSVSWARVVLDEAQQIKNPGTKVARAARALDASRRVALTGTPVENHLVELWSIMQFLNPGLLGSAASFRERFALPIQTHRDDETAARLNRITTPFVLRRLKTDRSIITDLPDKIETIDTCPLTREQVSLYQSVTDDLLARADELDGIARHGLVLAGISKLKQVCNHPAHFLGDSSSLPGRSGKLRRLEELVEQLLAAGDKALCFTQYTAWGDRLDAYLQARFGVESLWLHGGVKRTDRDAMVERFYDADGPPIMLLSLKAGGTGLNLTAASHVIHYDRWWNPAVEDQATDRAYRIGQQQSVQVHKLVSAGTIEERIDAVITQKRELADRVVGTGEDWLTKLDTDELAEVLTLSQSEVD